MIIIIIQSKPPLPLIPGNPRRQGGDIISSPSGYLQFHPQPRVGSSGLCEFPVFHGAAASSQPRSGWIRGDSDPGIVIFSRGGAQRMELGVCSCQMGFAPFPWMDEHHFRGKGGNWNLR